jgi:DNA repair ATPase RecN
MEKVLSQILTELQSLNQRASNIKNIQKKQGQDITAIKKDTKDIKNELSYVWDDIKTGYFA